MLMGCSAEKNEIDVLKKDMLDNVSGGNTMSSLVTHHGHQFDVNVLGVIHSINAFLPLLKTASVSTTARVITLSSGVGDLDFTLAAQYGGHVGYCISKAAVNMVVAKYAARFMNDNFVFLSISPGLVNTSTRSREPLTSDT